MSTLPDFLAPELRVVFCGTAAGVKSAESGGYYAGAGNEFWGTLYEVGLIPEPLGPHLSHRVLEFGIGLTDLAKDVASSSDRGLGAHYDVQAFVAKIDANAPAWVAFHGKKAAEVVASHLHVGRDVGFGEQAWSVAAARAFVVPSMSGANRDASRLEGKPSREAWFHELKRVVPTP